MPLWDSEAFCLPTEFIVHNSHRLVPTQIVLSAYFYHNLLCNGSYMACLFLLTTSIYLDYTLPVIPELDVVLEGQELEDHVPKGWCVLFVVLRYVLRYVLCVVCGVVWFGVCCCCGGVRSLRGFSRPGREHV